MNLKDFFATKENPPELFWSLVLEPGWVEAGVLEEEIEDHEAVLEEEAVGEEVLEEIEVVAEDLAEVDRVDFQEEDLAAEIVEEEVLIEMIVVEKNQDHIFQHQDSWMKEKRTSVDKLFI